MASHLRLQGIHSILRLAGGALLILSALAAATGALNNGIDVVSSYRTAPPGAFYLVGSHRMHLDCEGFGSPTILLDAGLGNDALIWSRVQPILARATRVCSYDRAGYGWSKAVDTRRDADHIVAELHGLLLAAGLLGPLVLVGHSIAGLYIRDYANLYPEMSSALFSWMLPSLPAIFR